MRRFDGSVPAGSVRLRPMTESFWVVGLELNPNLNNELQSFWVVVGLQSFWVVGLELKAFGLLD